MHGAAAASVETVAIRPVAYISAHLFYYNMHTHCLYIYIIIYIYIYIYIPRYKRSGESYIRIVDGRTSVKCLEYFICTNYNYNNNNVTVYT